MTGNRKRQKSMRYFPEEEFEDRLERVRASMSEKGLDACLIASPENIYYLCGLDHMGYFAYTLLVVPLRGRPILVTRAMERAVVRDQCPEVRHVGYTDGVEPPPPPEEPRQDLILSTSSEEGGLAGLQPSSTSYGMPTRIPGQSADRSSVPVRTTCQAIAEAGLASGHLAIEKSSSFLPFSVAEGILAGLPDAKWHDAAGIVEDCRLVKSPLELACTRRAAEISDTMMLSAIAAAGPGVNKREVMAAIYDAMFRRGGTYPGFVPLVRSTRTLEHEHGTWQDLKLSRNDLLFLEMSGCVRRYHAPMGRFVFIGRPPGRSHRIHEICREAIEAAGKAIAPGVQAGDVYRAWHAVLERNGLGAYRRHHCGYSVGIGYPPSWSGSGVPVGLREDSTMKLRAGMVFHLMSWLLRTGRGDAFLSDTAVVTDEGCEVFTNVSRDVIVR